MEAGGYLEKISVVDSEHTVFLFPGILGSLNGYVNVINELRSGCSIYGFEYPVDIASIGGERIEILGKICSRLIQDRQVSSLVHLVGWSMGGLVAFECGRHLQAMGRRTGSVILIDAFPEICKDTAEDAPAPAKGNDEDRPALWIQYLDLKCGRHTREKIIAGNFFDLSEEDRFGEVEKYEKKWSTQYSRMLVRRAELRFLAGNLQALRSYVPAEFDGSVNVLASDEYADLVERGWGSVSRPRVDCRRVGGDHVTVILHFALPSISAIIAKSGDGLWTGVAH